MGLPRRKRYARCHVEKLESRELFSVVNVTPQNFQAVIRNSSVGDTINFAAGNYNVAPNSVDFPASRHYIGNGADFVLNGSSGNGANLVNVLGGSGPGDQTEVTGFTFSGAQVACNTSGSYNVHGNTFTNIPSGNGIYIGGCHDSSFNFNTFTNMGNDGGIFGYPGDNESFDNNTFATVEEPIHLISNASNLDVSGNVMTGVNRIGIELQGGMQNLTIKNNYMALFRGENNLIAISCATGGTSDRKDGSVGCGNNITISGNVLLHTAADGSNLTSFGCPIEIMGKNITITDNLVWGMNGFILDGQWGSSTVSGDRIYDAGGSLWSGDFVNPAPSPIVSSDTIQPLAHYTPSATVPAVNSTPGALPGAGGSATSVAGAPTPTAAVKHVTKKSSPKIAHRRLTVTIHSILKP